MILRTIPCRMALRAAITLMFLGTLIHLPGGAYAINIVLSFDAAGSEYPAFDADASGLISLFNHAEDYYEDIFEDNTHTLNITYRYEDLAGGRTGLHSPTSFEGAAPFREDGALIRIDTTTTGGALRNWFIDPTPSNDSEFAMGQTFWRDLTTGAGGQQVDWYNFGGASVPATFEAGFTGNATAPAAMGARDMLTTILHEIGHALGMSSANPLTTAETGDGDYDYNTVFVDGESFGVETANTSGDDNLNIAHLESALAVMNPGGPGGARRRPSHTDLFAMASINQYGNTTVDVPRREFYSGSNWNNRANWSGNRTPDSNDDAFIRAAQGAGTTLTVTLSNSDTARNLTVAEGANFHTDDKFLFLGEDLTLSDTDTDVFIDPGGVIDAELVSIQNNAELRIISGTLFAEDIAILATADLIGYGTVNLDQAFAELNNNGRIAANGDGTLTFNSDNDIAFDLDGSGGDGVVQAIAGSLVFNSSLTDGFSSDMTVGPGRRIEFNSGAGFDSGALLLLDGSGAGDATVAGTLINMNSNSVLRADGPGVVDASIVLANNSLVEGASISSSIAFDGSVIFQGGDVVGEGLAFFNGDVFVQQDTVVSITAVDLDGTGGSNTVTISPNRELQITGIAVETGTDGYDGTLAINGGELAITPNWRLDGEANLTETGGSASVLSGPGEITVHTLGQITVVGDATIDAPLVVSGGLDVGQFGLPSGMTNANGSVEFNDTADVNVETGSFLDLEESAVYRGGSHTGVGTLRWNGPVTIASDTSISVVNLDWDGSDGATVTTVNSGATLSINSTTLDSNPSSPMDGTVNLNSGHLSVLTGWVLAGQINTSLFVFSTERPSINGVSGMTVATTGEVLSVGDAEINTDVVSNGLIRASEGVTFINGEITFNPSSSTVAFTPTLGFDDGATVQLNNLTTYNGGFFGGNGIIRQNGDATVVSPTTISAGRFDADGNALFSNSTIELQADLTLDVQQIDESEGFGRLDFNRHDGFFDIASGAALTVNLPKGSFWVAAGAVTLGDVGGAAAELHGSEVWFGNSQGGGVVVNAHHLARINAPSHFRSDVFVSVPLFGQDRLEINAPATFAGGSYGGAGMLAINHTATINADTTFATGEIDLDGDTPGDHLLLIKPGVQLTIINAVDIDDDGSHDDPIELQQGAQLAVNTPGTWHVGSEGSIFLNEPHPAGAVVSGQPLTSFGTISGNGTFDTDLANAGVLSPGLSPGQITVTQDYTQTTEGVLQVELAGTIPAIDHDLLDVTNTAHLAGGLEAALIDGYTPGYGDLHQVITAADVVDTFETHLGLLIDASLALAPLYSTTDLTLRASIPGDLNFDEMVSVADLSQFALFFDTEQPFYDPDTDTNSWELGDFNSDGAITVADLSLLALNFGLDAGDPASVRVGMTVEQAAALAGIDLAAIPEPNVLLVVMVLAGAELMTRGRFIKHVARI